MTTSRLIRNVAAALREEGIDMEDKLQVLSRSPDVTDPFKHLDSEYLQRQYFIKHFKLMVCTMCHSFNLYEWHALVECPSIICTLSLSYTTSTNLHTGKAFGTMQITCVCAYTTMRLATKLAYECRCTCIFLQASSSVCMSFLSCYVCCLLCLCSLCAW